MTLKEKINSIAKLTDNWNGYDAKKIPNKVIENSYIIAKNIQNPKVEIYPTGRETTRFVYEFKKINENFYVELEVYQDHFVLWAESSNLDTSHDEINFADINIAIKNFNNYILRIQSL